MVEWRYNETGKWCDVEKQRIDLWDNLKIVLMFLVVLGHLVDQDPESGLFQIVYVFIYAFHMPLFFFISGLFHRNVRIREKVLTFLALGYIYKFLLYAVRILLKEEVELRFFSESGTPWFLFALAIFILFTYLLRSMNPGFVLVIALLMAFFVGYDQSVGSKFILSRVFYFYPFYFMGSMVNGKKLAAVARDKRFRLLGAAILVLWLAACVRQRELLYSWKELFMGMKIEEEELLEKQCLIRMGFYGITLLTGFSCICLCPQRHIPFFTDMGRRTIQIYFWHRPILYIMADLGFVAWICGLPWGRAWYLLLAVPLTLLLALKPFSFPAAQILRFGRERGRAAALEDKTPDSDG